MAEEVFTRFLCLTYSHLLFILSSLDEVTSAVYLRELCCTLLRGKNLCKLFGILQSFVPSPLFCYSFSHLLISVCVLVWLGCHNKITYAEWFKQQSFVSYSWEVQHHGPERFSSLVRALFLT